MNDRTAIRTVMAPADPLLAQPVDGADTPAAQDLLARLLATPAEPVRPARPPHRRRRAVRLALTAAVLAVLAVAVLDLVPGRSGTPAVAATPPVLPYATAAGRPAAAALERIAHAAAGSSEPSSGPYGYVRTESWALNSAIAGRRVTSALASRQQEVWRRSDGSGRARATRGADLVDRVGSAETLEAVLTEPGTEDVVLPAGGPALPDPAALPYDDPVRFAQTVQQHETDEIPVAVDVAEAVGTLFREQPVPPAARARVWRLLAEVRAVQDRGRLVDRVGREGRAFTVDDRDGEAHGLPAQYLLLVDEQTGQLLEADAVLTTDPGLLNVRVPAVLSVQVLLQAGHTASTTQRPEP